MVWIGCLRCEKFRRDFVARTFALVRDVLQRVSLRNQMVPNASNQYKTHQNISLRSNGVDRVRSLRKILTRLRGTNFCTSSARFAPSFVTLPNCPKCTQIVRNARKHQFRVQWGGSGAFVAKNSDATQGHKLLHQFGPFSIEFHNATKRFQMHPNCMKCTKTSVQGPIGWTGCLRCDKF